MAYTYGDNAYCRLADVTGLGSEFTQPAAWTDAEVQTAIVDASQRIDAVTRSHFGETTRGIILGGRSTPLLRLTQVTLWPILTATQVEYREEYAATDDFAANGEVLDDDTYVISDSHRALLRIYPQTLRGGREPLPSGPPIWLRGSKNYKVTGTFGRNNVPSGVRQACALLVRERITPGTLAQLEQFEAERFPDGYSYKRRGGGSSLAPERLTGYPAVDELLAPHVCRIPLLAVAGG